jgi:N6-L-threonylcarbamoyladenine synthase
MIAMAAGLRWQRGMAHPVADYAFDVRPRWPLAEVSEPAVEYSMASRA